MTHRTHSDGGDSRRAGRMSVARVWVYSDSATSSKRHTAGTAAIRQNSTYLIQMSSSTCTDVIMVWPPTVNRTM